MRWWPWKREKRSLTSISNPAIARLFGGGPPNYSGVEVGESTAMALSAVYRSVSLIAGTLASLPMPTLRDTGDGMQQQVSSFLDDPGGPDGPTPFSWKETVFAHQLLHGDAFLYHVFGGAGQLVGLVPLHPQCVSVRWKRPDEADRFVGRKVFNVTLVDGTYTGDLDSAAITQVPGLSLDGLRGCSVIDYARNSLGTAAAGERSAARAFSSGAMISGLVTPEAGEVDGDLTPDEVKTVKDQVNAKIAGWENAGEIVVLSKALKFSPWQMTAEDAQFLQSRQFSVEEVSRWFGIPSHLLGLQTMSSWGTGIEVQNRGLARTVLSPWATRLEQSLSRLLANPRFVKFDFSSLERSTPEVEIDSLIKQVEAGLLTPDEARAVRGLPPLPNGAGAAPRTAAPAAPASEPEAVPV